MLEAVVADELEPGDALGRVYTSAGDVVSDVDVRDAAQAVVATEIVHQAPKVEVLDDGFVDARAGYLDHAGEVLGADLFAGLGQGIGADGDDFAGGVEEDARAEVGDMVIDAVAELGGETEEEVGWSVVCILDGLRNWGRRWCWRCGLVGGGGIRVRICAASRCAWAARRPSWRHVGVVLVSCGCRWRL